MRFIQSIKLVLAAVLTAGALAIVPASPALALTGPVCDGAAIAGSGCGGGDAQVNGLVRTAINLLSLIGGIAAVIIIIVCGIRLITSAGNSDALASARNGILYAIIGLVIIAFAQVIVRFVLGRLNT